MIRVSSVSQKMEMKRPTPIAPGKIGAWVCLFAVVMLWAPLWATAWQTDGMDCCKGGMCMAHGQGMTHRTSEDSGAKQESAPMDCGHVKHAGLTTCGMNCCHEEESSVVAAVIFVLPEPIQISEPAEARQACEHGRTLISSYLFEPPSPPPRNILPNA